jgi:hypothetical protein
VLALASTALVALSPSLAHAEDEADPDPHAPVVLPDPGAPYPTAVDPMSTEVNDGARPSRRAHRDVHRPTVFAPDNFPLAGYHGGHFYLRDDSDTFRFFPGILLQADSKTTFGRGVSDLSGAQAHEVKSQAYINRARLEAGGQVLKAWSFYLTGDLAPGKQRLEHALVDVRFHRWAHLTVGQQQVPFTMENRTTDAGTSWLDRPLAVRFGAPQSKDTGAMMWGGAPGGVFHYEVGVFGGDGQNHPSVDNRADVAGRVYVRPLAMTHSLASKIQIGASGTYGMRELRSVNYAMDPLTTNGGWTFWNTTYTDSLGRSTHILPSGAQSGFAGELRVPVSKLDFRFEFVSVRRNTREAVDGFEQTNTERLGRLKGVAYYAQIGIWIIGDPSIAAEPGEFRPPTLHFPHGDPIKPPRGLELLLRVEQLTASYKPIARSESATVGGAGAPSLDVKANVFGVGLKYHATSHAGVYINYTFTHLPDSGAGPLSTQAPGNLADNNTSDPNHFSSVHSLHELGGRFQVAFLSCG